MLALFLAGCQATGQQGDRSLYTALGEREGIGRLVKGLLYRIADDHRINHHFEGIDVARFHEGLTRFICDHSGGPCQYHGDPMPTVHRDMGITTAEFNALVEDLILVMEDQDIPVSAQNRLLAILAPMHGDIVNQ